MLTIIGHRPSPLLPFLTKGSATVSAGAGAGAGAGEDSATVSAGACRTDPPWKLPATSVHRIILSSSSFFWPKLIELRGSLLFVCRSSLS